jgi:hypothetical protein
MFGVTVLVAMSAGLVYLAFVLPSRMLGDTMRTPTVTPSHTMPAKVTPSQEQVTLLARHSVTVTVLEVRNGAGEAFTNVGYLRRGDSVTVYEVQTVTGETCRQWARIGAGEWTCYDYLEVTP